MLAHTMNDRWKTAVASRLSGALYRTVTEIQRSDPERAGAPCLPKKEASRFNMFLTDILSGIDSQCLFENLYLIRPEVSQQTRSLKSAKA